MRSPGARVEELVVVNGGVMVCGRIVGLQALPAEIDEAVALDGVGPLRTFFSITLPLVWPA
jgi:ABC-type sugar transport system permease subunit